jgi:hypothetical protein
LYSRSTHAVPKISGPELPQDACQHPLVWPDIPEYEGVFFLSTVKDFK